MTTTDESWSFAKWWNPSCNKACLKAEQDLIDAFIDNNIYQYQSRQISINFDPEPQSVKQKKLKRSKSFMGISWGNDDNIKSQTQQFSASAATIISNKESIHTLTFQIKSDKLQSFSQININDDNKNDIIHNVDNNEYDIDNDIINDGQSIEGKSMNKFFQRKVSQKGSSNYSLLSQEIMMNNNNNNNNICLAPIVLSHGYGCAGGIFIPSISTIYETLLSYLSFKESPIIHIIDMLGCGMSSRPEFECETTKETEDWFVESLEEWRKAMNINKMILCAHSLGGYAIAVYAMRYPQHIQHLILISPVGIPCRPSDSDESLKNYSWKVRTMFKTFRHLWNSGWTPHDLVRISGPKGKILIQKIIQKRLFRLNNDNPLKSLLAEYLYHVIAQQGSAEYALNKILMPGAWAYNPLSLRIGQLKQYQTNVYGYDDDDDEKEIDDNNNQLNSTMKIDFIYGETDWMTSAHAVKLKQNGTIKCQIYINKDCGHQLILENSKGFGQLLGGVIVKGQILSKKKKKRN